MDNWKNRLAEEYRILLSNCAILDEFLQNSGSKSKMSAEDWDLLLIQMSAMDTYLKVVQTRMDRNNIPYIFSNT